jgi:hypothetical protein
MTNNQYPITNVDRPALVIGYWSFADALEILAHVAFPCASA